MNIEQIMGYIMHTPHNTNRTILTQMLKELIKSDDKLTIKQLIDYVMYAPHNTNRAIFTQMVKEVDESGAAGLYKTGSNYTILLKSWDELLAEGAVCVENGVVYTPYDSDNAVNLVSHLLVGDLALPNDETITRIGNFKADGQNTGNFGFPRCENLTGIKIPNSVLDIGYAALSDCHKLRTVEIPNSVVAINHRVFYGCNTLEKVIFEGNAPELGDEVFYACPSDLVIYYYENTTGWDVSPWTNYVTRSNHIGTYITEVEATCTTEGVRHIDCSYCNEAITETIPRVRHNYVNAVCSVCGDIEVIASGTCGDNINWTLTGDYTLRLAGTGNMATYTTNSRVPWAKYRNSIKNVIISDGITDIGKYVFYQLSNLTSINIPEDVITIGSYAFSKCANLKNVNIPNSVTKIDSYAFNGCTSLTEIIIPESVTQVGASVFYGCKNLTSIVLPEGLTSLGQQAFYSCENLASVVIPASLGGLGKKVFSGCTNLTLITYTGTVEQWNNLSKVQDGDQSWNYEVPATEVVCSDGSVKLIAGLYETGSNYTVLLKSWDELLADGTVSIENGAAKSQATYNGNASSDALAGDLYFPNDGSVTEIKDNGFKQCQKLTGVYIPSKITSLGNAAFLGAFALEHIILPEGLVSIGEDAFASCASTEIIIPDSVTNLGSGAFRGCAKLEKAVVGAGITSIASQLFINCKALKDIVINYDNITSIGNGAFSGCESITSVGPVGSGATVEIPDSVTALSNTFKECHNLTNVELPNSITSIGSSTFYNCSFTTITIPASVTEIGQEAFALCTNLTSIVYEGTMEQWNAISKYQSSSGVMDWNYRVSVTEVVCSDGIVTLNIVQ